MDEDHSPPEFRLAVLSPKAALDLSANHIYTTEQWDFDQAEKYTEFLKAAIRQLVERPDRGNPVAGRPGTFEHVVKWKRARHGHPHRLPAGPGGYLCLAYSSHCHELATAFMTQVRDSPAQK
jgi:plasmid stabilization system protein ParE